MIVFALGKGEVHSSILCGSTIEPFEINAFCDQWFVGNLAGHVTDRHDSTERDGNRWGSLGRCSHDVRSMRSYPSAMPNQKPCPFLDGPVHTGPSGMTQSVDTRSMSPAQPAVRKRRNRNWMKRMRPMSEFDPSLPAMVHDRLNDRTFEWVPATMEANYRQYAVTVADVVEWDGLQMDGWEPRAAAAPSR